MQATTGLRSEAFEELVGLVRGRLGGWDVRRGRPRALPLARAVHLVLFLLRHNLAQAAAAELVRHLAGQRVPPVHPCTPDSCR
jgi:hypothetical protein